MARSLTLGTIAWLALGSVAFAGSPGSSLLAPKAVGTDRTAPRPRAVTTNPCAAYGPNFARVEGTETCVKIGGAVRVEMGTSAGR